MGTECIMHSHCNQIKQISSVYVPYVHIVYIHVQAGIISSDIPRGWIRPFVLVLQIDFKKKKCKTTNLNCSL